jgi:hypothetical protein
MDIYPLSTEEVGVDVSTVRLLGIVPVSPGTLCTTMEI